MVRAAIVVFAAGPAYATTFTFDNSLALSSNFNVDVRPGDGGTYWVPGYGSLNGFPGSAGGFVHFDNYQSAHSIQFKDGPVTLNSFQISSQRGPSGDGVGQAQAAANDYTLHLYDASGNLLFSEYRLIAAGGVWETLTFNLPNVSTIWVAQTGWDFDHTGTYGSGWWPVIDNVRVNEVTALDDGPVSVTAGVAAVIPVGANDTGFTDPV
ncbi:MAG: hypothetical protein ABIX37_05580, partial [Gammaproteobacteria bacterium]